MLDVIETLCRAVQGPVVQNTVSISKFLIKDSLSLLKLTTYANSVLIVSEKKLEAL